MKITIKKTLRLCLIAGGGLIIILTLHLSNYHHLSYNEQEYYCSRCMQNIAALLALYSVEQNVPLSPDADVNGILNTYGRFTNQCPITGYPYRIVIDLKENKIIIIEEHCHDGTIKKGKEFSRELLPIIQTPKVALWREADKPSEKIFEPILRKYRDYRIHTWPEINDFSIFEQKFNEQINDK